MKPVGDKTNEKATEDVKSEETKPKPPTPVAEIKTNVALIDRAVATMEPRFTHRVLRTLATLRKKIDATVLHTAIVEVYGQG